jgi:hypothetical protein
MDVVGFPPQYTGLLALNDPIFRLDAEDPIQRRTCGAAVVEAILDGDRCAGTARAKPRAVADLTERDAWSEWAIGSNVGHQVRRSKPMTVIDGAAWAATRFGPQHDKAEYDLSPGGQLPLGDGGSFEKTDSEAAGGYSPL